MFTLTALLEKRSTLGARAKGKSDDLVQSDALTRTAASAVYLLNKEYI